MSTFFKTAIVIFIIVWIVMTIFADDIQVFIYGLYGGDNCIIGLNKGIRDGSITIISQ